MVGKMIADISIFVSFDISENEVGSIPVGDARSLINWARRVGGGVE